MDRFLLLIVAALIYVAHSAPSPQLLPQQNSLYPSYFYEQLPFIYSPYPNPFYSYNYLTPPGKLANTKSEDKKSVQTDKVETKSATPYQVPLIPVIQYVPAYGRNLDSWSAKEIPVRVIVDENFEKSYNIPYAFQHPYVRNYVETSKQNPEPTSQPVQDTGSITIKTSEDASQFIDVRSSPIDKSRYVQGAPLIPNVASINTPQASISFYPQYQGLYGRDLPNWNVNEIPISALVVDDADKNTPKEVEKHDEKSDEKVSTTSSVISNTN